MRWPVTNSARSHQCEPMSAKAREAPPSVESTRQLSSSGSQSASPAGRCRGRAGPGPWRRCGRARAPRAPSGSSGRRTGTAAAVPDEAAASTSRCAPARRCASGFSQTTCLPAASAASASGSVQVVGRADVHDVDVGGSRPAPRELSKARSAPSARAASCGAGRRGGGDADDARAGEAGGAGVDGADEAGAGDGDSEGRRHCGGNVSRTLIVCQAEV